MQSVCNNSSASALAVLLFFLVLQASAVVAKEYDYIVVGAGSAGSIVAAKLVQGGASVLVLEAGGDDSDPAVWEMISYFDVAFNPFDYGFLKYTYESVGQIIPGIQDQQVYSLPRGKVLGGTHAINAIAFVTGHKADFDLIARDLQDDDWAWKNVKSYMEDLQQTLDIAKHGREQVGGEDYIASAEDVLDLKYNEDCEKGNQNGICPVLWTGSETETGGVRSTSYDAYLRGLTTGSNTNVDVVTHHRVDKLVFDETSRANSKKVIGVEAYNLRAMKSVSFTATKEVILCGGTYNTPQLLLLSGIGPRQELEAMDIKVQVALAGVGKNLRDHYSSATAWDLDQLPADTPFLFQSPTFNIFGPEKQGQTTYQVQISGTYGSVVALRAESVGEVTLRLIDPTDSPLIDPKAVSTESDFEALVSGLRDMVLPFFGSLIEKGIIKTIPGVSLDPSSTDDEIRAYLRSPNNIASSHHPVGTCKVGTANDPMAVVDQSFVVFGTSNLRVIDASVFPLAPSSDINAPTMAVALLGAYKIDPVFSVA